jgi:GTP-binding nuclear protein Ran
MEQKWTAEFKLIMVGDGGVGKTSFVKRFKTGEQAKVDRSTPGYDVYEIPFFTSHGPIKLLIWDIAGSEKQDKIKDCFFIGAHCAILMFDLTSRISYKNVPDWYKEVTSVCDNVPIVLVGNKVEA